MNKTLIIIKILTIYLLTTTIIACGGGGGGGSSDDSFDPTVSSRGTLTYSPATCSDSDQLQFIYNVMHDVYLWAETSPTVSISGYTSQSTLINDLRSSQDSWSYVISQTDYNNYYAGSNIGLGVKMSSDSNTNEIFITHVYPGSPADTAGIRRGYSLTSVNGYSASSIIANDEWDDAFGPSESGYVVDIDYIDNSNATGSASITKASYYADSVAAHTVLNNSNNGNKIGYLAYLNFSGNYEDDLEDAFNDFVSNNVKELVIDLRYNGGGLTNGARYLGSQIAGASNAFSNMFTFIHNTKYSSWNTNNLFPLPSYNLSIEKVVFLTTSSTASSSEILISGLDPYVDTYIVGSATHGKPVGMYSFSYCDNYIVPITFKNVNSEGHTDYFDGISANCLISDDVTKQLGDSTEATLASAINYLENGTCNDGRGIFTTDLKAPERRGINKIFDVR